jgi:hypothetical protein
LTSLLLRSHESYSRSRAHGETIGQKRDPQLRRVRDAQDIRTNDGDLVLSDDAVVGHPGI